MVTALTPLPFPIPIAPTSVIFGLFMDENPPSALEKCPHTDDDNFEGFEVQASKRERCDLDETR